MRVALEKKLKIILKISLIKVLKILIKKRNLFKRRREIIDQKKLIKPEEYKEKVNKLRTKVQSLQKREINY